VRYLLGAAAIAGVVAACAINPVSGEKEFVLMSEEQEIDLGRKNDPQIRREYGVYPDARLQAYVQRVGEKLAVHSHRPGLVYRFTVLDSSQVNAFALPGGYIYITRGILAYLNSEAELAAVLGHELGHVTARHSVRQYSAAMAAGVGASILGAVVPELGSQVGRQLLDIIGNTLLSGYGREHELESDRLGAEYLARAGYDPDAMIGVVGILKNQEEFEKARAKAEAREPRIYHGVFASHPSADRRLQEVVAQARKFKTGPASRVAREEWLQRLDGIVFGDGAREGIRHGSNFYHRDFDLALHFPSGWRIENSTKAVTATGPEKDAMLQLQVEDLNVRMAPRDFMLRRLKLERLSQEGALEGQTLPAHTAVSHINTPYGRRDARVNVIYHHNRAFILYGATKDPGAFVRFDPLFLQTARSLHPLTDKERRLAEGLRLRVVKARSGDTFVALAKKAPLNTYAESVLRLINDRYPKGEPRSGESIKVIE
jgi:predicted Zn-dependent protease